MVGHYWVTVAAEQRFLVSVGGINNCVIGLYILVFEALVLFYRSYYFVKVVEINLIKFFYSYLLIGGFNLGSACACKTGAFYTTFASKLSQILLLLLTERD